MGSIVSLTAGPSPPSNTRRVGASYTEDQTVPHPAGLAVVDRAKADGTWTALDAVEQLTEPDDLRQLLDADPTARTEWDAFPRSTRRAILEWLGTARTDVTRHKRLERIVTDAHHGIRANQWRQPKRR